MAADARSALSGAKIKVFSMSQLREFEFKFAEYLLQSAARTQPAPRGAVAGNATPSPGLGHPLPQGEGGRAVRGGRRSETCREARHAPRLCSPPWNANMRLPPRTRWCR